MRTIISIWEIILFSFLFFLILRQAQYKSRNQKVKALNFYFVRKSLFYNYL
jgi:hypothetical protein